MSADFDPNTIDRPAWATNEREISVDEPAKIVCVQDSTFIGEPEMGAVLGRALWSDAPDSEYVDMLVRFSPTPSSDGLRTDREEFAVTVADAPKLIALLQQGLSLVEPRSSEGESIDAWRRGNGGVN